MNVKKLVTLAFEKNVGTPDRIFRLLSGAALTAGGWYLALPTAAALALSVLGAMWVLTGVLSKCSIYYVLGYSTCPAHSEPFPGRSS
jgi:uncharacterized membrane protein HdeD (DUF308 family)